MSPDLNAIFLRGRRLGFKRRSLGIVVILLCLVGSPVLAQKPVLVRGAGVQSCATYAQAYEAYRPFAGKGGGGIDAMLAIGTYEQYEAWIQGYLYGVDSWNAGQIRQFDRAGLQLWVYNYCQQHPLELVVNAALAFYKEVGGPTPTGGNR